VLSSGSFASDDLVYPVRLFLSVFRLFALICKKSQLGICHFSEFDRRRKIKTLVSVSTCLQFLITEVLPWASRKQFGFDNLLSAATA
jgi:hypothetical protein